MKEFWTCGPFKDANDRWKQAAFNIGQMQVFMELIEEEKSNQELIKNGSADEQQLAILIQLDIDKKMKILLGVPDGTKEKADEIFGKTVFESIDKRPKE
tara:strand:+ start:1024 stop:1320 length:297 start_codon:yes stop_codon:yes gene_type:complete